MIVTSFFIYFVIFPTIVFVSFPNPLNVSLEQRVGNEDVMNLFRTNESTAEDEHTDSDGDDAIGDEQELQEGETVVMVVML
jgi:hypothetical protein